MGDAQAGAERILHVKVGRRRIEDSRSRCQPTIVMQSRIRGQKTEQRVEDSGTVKASRQRKRRPYGYLGACYTHIVSYTGRMNDELRRSQWIRLYAETRGASVVRKAMVNNWPTFPRIVAERRTAGIFRDVEPGRRL